MFLANQSLGLLTLNIFGTPTMCEVLSRAWDIARSRADINPHSHGVMILNLSECQNGKRLQGGPGKQGRCLKEVTLPPRHEGCIRVGQVTGRGERVLGRRNGVHGGLEARAIMAYLKSWRILNTVAAMCVKERKDCMDGCTYVSMHACMCVSV